MTAPRWGGVIAAAAAAMIVAATAGAAPAPGTILNAETWQQAEGMMPPEFLDRYKNGQWQHQVVEAPAGTHFGDEDFLAAGEKNGGQYALGADGGIVESGSGKQPAFIYGPPFPVIDKNDPQAGAKIVWNFFYQSYLLGNSHNQVNLDWVGTGGMQRSIGTDVYQHFFDGQPEKYRPKSNEQNFLFQQISAVTAPADLQGTVALTHRFRDPSRRHQAWTLVPALRRVRAVSPTNRSDGFLGSDMSQDDGPFFDGKPEDFEWKLLESKDQLRLTDEAGLAGKSRAKWLPGGGWRTLIDPNAQTVGFEKPGWTGLAWAPVGMALAKRPVWIIEATPKDKYYLYGKVQLYVDKETYQGVYNRKFNWRNELMNTYMISGFMSEKRVRPDGGEDWLWGATQVYQAAENVKMNRATVSGLPYADKPESAVDRRISFDPSFFDFNTLQRFGK
jgi:hypothetical protein